MRNFVEHSLIAFARRRSVKRTLLLLATTALTSPLLVVVAQAQNLPTGGSVAAGNVAIAQPSANQLNITQSSQSAVVNWQSFSVGQGSAVNIAQPNSSAALLNRVTGNTPSTISGSITANGQVYLVNPNGIAITQSGTVNTGGFVASTLGISDADFMAGKRTFTGNGASAAVSNAGSINVGRGGYAALIGGTVSNSGSINVPLGKAGLGSGEQATLDFSGDGFLQVAVPTSAGGSGALIRNSGSITADGGSVTISAATAREAARNAVNISGVVQARSIDGHNGAIVIGGGAGGKVKISGRLGASSPHGTGGRINVTGNNIKLRRATVDASGKTGGGSIAIGGGIRGSGPLQRAETTSIDSNTVIKADAVTSGNGGNVVVWSDQLTTFAGTISAQGGALGGDGGFVETSGKERLSVRDTAFVNTLAPMGATGNWLLDPRNITIATGGAATLPEGSFGSGNDASDITIAPTTINAAASNVTLQANNDITINNSIGMTNSVMLTLNAGRSILVNANVVSKGGFTATINDAGAASANRSAGKAAFAMAAGTSISTAATVAGANGGNVSITTGTLAADSTGATSLAANIGDITLAAINTSGLGGANSSGAGGSITVTNAQGNILSAASGTVTLTANAAVATSGTAGGKAGGAVQLLATNGSVGSVVTSFGAISAVGANGLGTNQAGGNGGAVTLTAGTNIWDRSITTTQGTRTGTGTVGVIGAVLNQASNGSITMTTDTLNASGMTFTANAGSGIVTIQSATASTTMGIANSGSALNLTAANLSLMTAKTLMFGAAANTGGIIIGTVALPAAVGNVVATSGSLDVAGFGAVTVNGSVSGANGNLTLNATATDVYLQSGIMTIGTLTANGATQVISSGSFFYNNTSGIVTLNAAGVDPNSGTESIALGGAITANTLKLSGPGEIYQQTGAFKVTNVLVQGGTFIDLSGGNNTNQIANFAANTTGRIKLHDNVNLNIASVGGVDGVTADKFNLSFASTNKSVTQSASANITANEFSVVSGGTGTFVVNATLTNAGNQIGSFAAAVTSTGTINLAGINGLSIGQLKDNQDNTIATGVTAGTLTLSNTGTVTQTSRISATNLALLGTGGIYNLTSTSNVVATLAANTGSVNFVRTSAGALATGTVGSTVGITATGDVTLTSAGHVTVGATGAINAGGAVTLTTTGAATDITLNGAVTTSTNTLTLNGKRNITQAAAGNITTANLLLLGAGGSHTLTNTGNSVGKVAANTGTVNLVDNSALTVGTVGVTNGVTATGAVTLASAGNIAIDPTARVVAGANSNAVLSAAGNFVNNRGSDAIGVSGTGRWLVYSSAPAGNTFGDLNSNDTAVWHQTMASLAPGSVSGTNRYIFAYQPTLTVTTTDLAKTYGVDATAAVGASYAVSGLQSGVANAYSGDTASVYSGAPVVTSAGSASSSTVSSGPYDIIATTGTLTASSGYALNLVNTGKVMVNPAALTITAANQLKTYGDTKNLGTTGFTTAGLVTANGDDVTGVTLASTGAAGTAGVNGGTPYSIDASAATGSGLSNYTIAYVSGGLTVNPAALTITAANQNKTYGDTANLGTTGFTTAGLVTANGDSVAGVTLASTGAAANAGVNGGTPYSLDASAATGSGLSNYTVSYVSGGLTVNPAALTITASNAGKTYGQSLTFVGTGFGTSGLRNGETVGSVTLASAGAAGTADVAGSPYAITASVATGGSFNSANYTIAYVNGALTVAPANITVTADSQTRTAGTPNASLTYQLSGNLYNGDSLTGALATNATTASPAGSYSITQGSLAASANYNLTYQGALLTVTPATSQSGNSPTPSTPATLPGSFARDSFYPVILPDNARPVFGAATFSTSEGTGVLYADPRFDKVFVCFTSAPGAAQSCYAAGNIKG